LDRPRHGLGARNGIMDGRWRVAANTITGAAPASACALGRSQLSRAALGDLRTGANGYASSRQAAGRHVRPKQHREKQRSFRRNAVGDKRARPRRVPAEPKEGNTRPSPKKRLLVLALFCQNPQASVVSDCSVTPKLSLSGLLAAASNGRGRQLTVSLSGSVNPDEGRCPYIPSVGSAVQAGAVQWNWSVASYSRGRRPMDALDPLICDWGGTNTAATSMLLATSPMRRRGRSRWKRARPFPAPRHTGSEVR
jgi:hypothetical protein